MDLSKIKSKMNSLKSGGSAAKSEHLFQIPKGETTVRIVPLKSNPDWPFFEAYFHYNMNKRSYVSPKTYGNPDPILEFAQDAQESATSKEEWKQAKQLEPKRRVFAPIIVRGKESEGVKFWGFSDTIYETILGLCDDPDYGDITDLETGTDIVITKKTPEEVGNQYGETSIRPKRNPSQVAKEDKLDEVLGVIKNQPDILEMDYFQAADYDTLSEALHKYLRTDESISDQETSSGNGFGDTSKVLSVVEESTETEAEQTEDTPQTTEKPNFKNLFS